MTDPPPADGYRSYEVYQRERIGQSTNLIKARQLISDGYRCDPYPLLAILREHYPCYRDWVGNRFWITRYDDVTSVLADTANYETRTKAWAYGRLDHGRDLGSEVAIQEAWTSRIDDGLDRVVGRVLDELPTDGTTDGTVDLARGFAGRLPLELWGLALDLDDEALDRFAVLWWTVQRGAGWEVEARQRGLDALDELTRWFDELLADRGGGSGDDLVTAAAGLALAGGPVTGADLAITVLEADHETLHGGLANLWFHLLTGADHRAAVAAEPRLMKAAWLETLRHSPPVLSGRRFTRHEVERFGRLLPEGALVECSAAAANRDPRAFADPDRFVVGRKDLCQREPRGQYRADGLPSGIAVGLGLPSLHPAEPRDRPRSSYALTRDVAVTASRALLEAHPAIALAPGAEPELASLRLGEMHTCWSLPVVLDP